MEGEKKMPKVKYLDEAGNNEEKNTSVDIDDSLLEIGIRKGKHRYNEYGQTNFSENERPNRR